jgi:Phage major capsid protein E
MALVQQSVVVDPALSNVSIKYMNDVFIADQIFPMVKVAKQTGKYYVYDKSNLRINQTTRAAGAGANEVDFGLSTSSFACDDHALKEFVADEIQDQADAALNPLVDATESVTEQLLLDRENKLATIMGDTAQITNNTTLSGTSQWSDYSNSDPIGDVRTARTTVHQNTFKKPNTLIMSKPVFDMLIEHPAIIERIKYSQLGVVTQELLARVFQVEKILVGEAGSNTAKEGQTDSLSYVWGKNAIVCFVAPQIRLKQITLGYCFTYSQRLVKRWRDEDREGTYVRVGNDNYVFVVVAVGAGYLIKNAIA